MDDEILYNRISYMYKDETVELYLVPSLFVGLLACVCLRGLLRGLARRPTKYCKYTPFEQRRKSIQSCDIEMAEEANSVGDQDAIAQAVKAAVADATKDAKQIAAEELKQAVARVKQEALKTQERAIAEALAAARAEANNTLQTTIANLKAEHDQALKKAVSAAVSETDARVRAQYKNAAEVEDLVGFPGKAGGSSADDMNLPGTT
jgi:hypothetical protein